MIPAIDDHFIERARERAPWLLNLDGLNHALQHAWVAQRKNNVQQIIKHGFKRTVYLIVPRLGLHRKAIVLVISDDQLKTVYRVETSEWARNWLANQPKNQRKTYTHGQT